MSQHQLTIAGIQVAFELDGVTIDDFTSISKRWLPDVRRSDTPRPPDLHVRIAAGHPSLRYHRNGFAVRGDNGTFHTCLDASVVLSRYLERELNRAGRWSIHCSAIAVNGRAHLLLGKAGSGKTTLAAACRMRDRDVMVLAGDRAVIEHGLIVAGTTTLHFRNGTLRHHLAGLVAPPPPAEDMWGQWTTLDYPDVWPAAFPVHRISLVRLSAGPAILGRVAPPDDFLRTLEQLVHFGEVFPCVALEHMQPIPIFTTNAIQVKRIAAARDLMAPTGVQTLSGDLDALVDVVLGDAR